MTGTSKLTIEKDRPGQVRSHAAGGVFAVFEATSYPDGSVTAQLLAPSQASSEPPWTKQQAALEHLCVYSGESKSALAKEAIKGRTEDAYETIKWLVANGYVEVEQVGQLQRHSITEAGREYLEEHSP